MIKFLIDSEFPLPAEQKKNKIKFLIFYNSTFHKSFLSLQEIKSHLKIHSFQIIETHKTGTYGPLVLLLHPCILTQ